MMTATQTARRLAEPLQEHERSFADLADAARVLAFTRARVTQLVDLTLLAPDNQETLLLAGALPVRDAVTERGLRAVLASGCWRDQRAVAAMAK